MADIKWIKFYVSILTDRKIKRIRRMPAGDTIALIWAFLLAQAGESNKDGAIYFNDEIPYAPEDFAQDYDFEIDTVKLAVATFEKLKMICVYDGIIYIKNWEKYQSIDGMEKIREQNRIRQAAYKDRMKIQQKSNVSGNVTVTQGNAIDIDIEEDKEKDIEKKNISNSRFTPPTLEEVMNYCLERNNNVDAEKFIDFYSSKGWMVGKNKMKDWKACVRTWEKDSKPVQAAKQNKFCNFETTDYDFGALEKELLQ